jgi:hypothetical protein
MPDKPHHPLPERDDARNGELPEHMGREKGFADSGEPKPDGAPDKDDERDRPAVPDVVPNPD